MAKKDSNDENIKSIIQRAIDIVKDIEEPYRLKAFEVVLSKLWPPSFEEKQKLKEKSLLRTGEMDIKAKIEEFAAECDLSVEQLTSIYDFQKDKPLLIIPLQGNHADRQVFASRFLLAAYSEVYGVEWVNLRQPLSEHQIRSLANLAKNLKKEGIFGIRGTKKATEYKLLDTAKHQTYSMIHEFAIGHSQG